MISVIAGKCLARNASVVFAGCDPGLLYCSHVGDGVIVAV